MIIKHNKRRKQKMKRETTIEELKRKLGRELTDCERWHRKPSWFPGCCDDCNGCKFNFNCETDN